MALLAWHLARVCVFNTLTVRLHHQAAPLQDAVATHLCAELNATETLFPTPNLRLIYELSGSP